MIPSTNPRGWPSHNYAGATSYYTDFEGRTVNVVNPFGGVSTAEYNSHNQVTRTLSAADRETALKEAKPVEASEQLDTKSTYNSEGELTDTWGPLHTVKLAAGKKEANEEVKARNHVHYTYDTGAPKNEEQYELVTQTTDGAETLAKEEFDKRTTVTAYNGQNELGWKLRKPTSVTVEPEGLDQTTITKYNETTGHIIETQTPAATGKDAKVPPAFGLEFGGFGTEKGYFEGPSGVAVDSSEDVWVTDTYNDRVQKFSSTGTWLASYGKLGSSEKEVQFDQPVALAINHTTGNVYVADTVNNRIVELKASGALVRVFGKTGAGAGQFKGPEGVAIDASGNVWVADWVNNRVDEFKENGEFLATFGFGVSNGEDIFEICTSSCRAGIEGSGNGQFKGPDAVSISGGDVFVSDSGNGRIEEFSESTRKYIASIGSPGTGQGQLGEPRGVAEDTSGDIYVTDRTNHRVGVFNIASGAWVKTFGIAGRGPGQFESPQALTVLASGKIYVTDYAHDRVQQWLPTVTGNLGAHDEQDIYYSAKEEAGVTACEKRPEWVGMPCETRPAEQPATTGPQLPVTVTTYNVWNQPEKITETFGTTTRTRTNTYDEAARPTASEETASTDTTLPKLKVKYSTSTGLVEEQTSTLGSTTHKILTTLNAFGAMLTYTDADGNAAHYTYTPEGRLTEMTDGSEGGKGKETFSYSEETGAATNVALSGVGTFGATYNTEGRVLTETYPNGMTAYYTYNPVGATTKIEYKKTTHCTEEHEQCVWFKDAVTPSIHGETMQQASSLSEEPAYTYNAEGALTGVEETPAGGGCTTRLYTYDEEENRATETEREPTSEKRCASEGGTTQWHTYGTGNAMTDPGVTYDAFADTTKLPAADAGGHELTATYYVDGQTATETQSGETNEYQLDPDARARDVVSTGTRPETTINHYDGGGQTVAWTSGTIEGVETTSRELRGIGGALVATVASLGGSSGAELFLHDLDGNIVARAGISETETKLLGSYNSTPFGVPSTAGQPPKYAWLGSAGITSELSSGTVTQDGETYVPQTGRPLQTEALELPNPVNIGPAYTDPGPAYTIESDAEAGSRRIAEGEQTRHTTEQANAPAGEVPRPTGGSFEATFGFQCTGSGACAANYRECTLHGYIQEIEPVNRPGIIWGGGNVTCNGVVGTLQLEGCLYVSLSEKGPYQKGKGLCRSITGYHKDKAVLLIESECAEAAYYKYVEIERAWSANFFSAGGRETRALQCQGDFTAPIVTFVEGIFF